MYLFWFTTTYFAYRYNIKYTDLDCYVPIPSKHFIFALDVSGSMNIHWDGVKMAVDQFTRSKEKASPVEHLVSCITYDLNAYISFSFLPCVSKVFERAKFTGGGIILFYFNFNFQIM
jgi:hypothetical protein